MHMFVLFLAMVQGVPEEPIDWDKEFGVEEVERDPITGELPVDPYVETNANADADPFSDGKMAAQFGGNSGIRASAERTVTLSQEDARIAEIFAAHDMVRLNRTLYEQFCYLLNAGCDYTGRNMRTAHADMGVERADMNALVENLQQAMREAGVPFGAQNRFLAKLAPMSKDIVTR
ncbi:MAG: group 1 truncated hemoglobin [Pontixanthobacter sp.]